MTDFNSNAEPVTHAHNNISNCSYLSESYDLLEAPMPLVDEKHKTRLWQQSQYLSDSGIHSAVGIHTPSINSKLSLEDIEPDESTLNQLSGPYMKAWSSGDPISVFPTDSCMLSPGTPNSNSVKGMDISDDVASLSRSRSELNFDTCGGKLPEIDTDEAAVAIPELVRLIKDEDDQVVIYQASMMVFQLSKSEAIDALIQSNEVITCILSALNRTDDPETVRFLAGTLYNLSQTQIGLKEIFIANCIPCLVNLLSSPVESVLFYSITTLHNLLLHQEGSKVVVRQSGCLQKMTALLQKNNIKFLTICTDCLQILAYRHQESKMQILSTGGPSKLIRILQTYQYEKLLWTTARVLKVLSVCTANKQAIIQAGGITALSKHLHHPSQRLVLNCLWTLRNLSDAATKLHDLLPLLQTLSQMLGSGDLNVITCAAGILSNLTCNNSENKLAVYKMGGLKGLIHSLGHPNAKEEIFEPCMCALRHLTSHHAEEEKARREFVVHLGGLGIVAHILHAATAGVCPELGLVCQSPQNPLISWTLIKAIVGLLRNLSMNSDNLNPMRESGLVSGLTLLLYASQYEISKRKVCKVNNCIFQAQVIVQNVRLEEIIEGISVAIHMLAREPGVRLYLSKFRAPNISFGPCAAGSPGIYIFVHLLYSQNECIQRAAAGIIVEASQDRENLEVLASIPGAICRLEELVHSGNEAISTYSSALIIRLTEERKASTSPILTPDLDPLNTPPHPMDMGERMSPFFNTSQLHTPSYLLPSQYTRYNTPLQSYHLSGNHQLPIEQSVPTNPQPGSLSAMLGPPPSAYGHSVQSLNQHCYQQGNLESVYPSYWNSYTGSNTDSVRVYGGPQCETIYAGYQPMANGPVCDRRSSTDFYCACMHKFSIGHSEVIDQQADAYMKMMSPLLSKHEACFSLDTSGYASPTAEKQQFCSTLSHQRKHPLPPTQAAQSMGPSVHALSLHPPDQYMSSAGCKPSAPPIQSTGHNVTPTYLDPDLIPLGQAEVKWLNSPTMD